MAFIEGRGIHRNSRFWRGPDKYDYHQNRTMAGGRTSLRCVKFFLERCPGRCSAVKDGSNFRDFRQTTCHNHEPDAYKIQERALRHALMARCRAGDHTRFSKMYKKERRRLKIPVQAASRIPLVKLRSSMRRARLENRPQVPKSLKDMDKILRLRQYRKLTQTLDDKDNIYAGRAGSARRKTLSLIFASKRMLRTLNKKRKRRKLTLFCDATFCPVPRAIKAAQVWNMSTIRNHHVIPLVRVLMRKRTKETYLAALEKIKTLAPRLKPEKIMTDYERAEQGAMQTAFPEAEMHGCLFHYAKAIGGKARKLGMYKIIKKSHNVRGLVRWLSCLPLLPTDLIKKGFRVVTKEAIKKRKSHHMAKLLKYWSRTWLPKLHLLSVSGCDDRTTNASESDNRMLQDAVPVKRPNVWDFLDGVIDMEDTTHHNIHVLKSGGVITRTRALSAVSNDKKIQSLTSSLEVGDISVKHFLKVASYTTWKSLNRGLNGKRRKRNV